MVSSSELATVVVAVAKTDWFRVNRDAVCRTNVLVRVLEGAGIQSFGASKSPLSKLRPLPRSVVGAPSRLTELLPNILAWAKEREIVLCVDESASLASNAMCWEAEELASLLSDLSPRGFQAGSLAPLLVDFLALLGWDNSIRQSIGPLLVSALRKAMQEPSALASAEILTAALDFIPSAQLFRLPPSVEHRQILRATASAKSQVLPVRAAWLRESHSSPQLSDGDLEALLDTLEPLIDGDNSDDAATAALAMLVNAQRELEALAQHPKFAATKVLRARNVRDRESVVAISLRTLLDHSKAGLLFGSSPDANSYLPAACRSCPRRGSVDCRRENS